MLSAVKSLPIGVHGPKAILPATDGTRGSAGERRTLPMEGAIEMSEDGPRNAGPSKEGRRPYRVRLPGFIGDEEVGLGDIVKRTTSAIGIQPCGDCAARAAWLNRWVIFSGRRQK